ETQARSDDRTNHYWRPPSRGCNPRLAAMWSRLSQEKAEEGCERTSSGAPCEVATGRSRASKAPTRRGGGSRPPLPWCRCCFHCQYLQASPSASKIGAIATTLPSSDNGVSSPSAAPSDSISEN